MNLYLYILVGIVYTLIGINYIRSGNTGLALAFFSYAVSNIGLYIAGK